MKEMVIISGKGGTGKTSITASFAALASQAVLADCDVDAADLHLILHPQRRFQSVFSGGKLARIRPGHCVACGKCEEVCRFDAIFFDGPGNGRVRKTFRVDPIACEGCGVCYWFCDHDAIAFEDAINGKWFISDTRFGPLIHARLTPGSENSGKLVSLVREKALKLAKEEKKSLIISDGAPGIGCAVIASLTGASMVLVVTEPTLSGIHDMERVVSLAKHFDLQIMSMVNKWDINPDLSDRIKAISERLGIEFAGKVRYDETVIHAQIQGMSVVEMPERSPSGDDIRSLWELVSEKLSKVPDRDV